MNQTGKAGISPNSREDDAETEDVENRAVAASEPVELKQNPGPSTTVTPGSVQPFPIHPGIHASKPTFADQIGKGLRMVYDDVLAQPVPDRFLDLLQALENKVDESTDKTEKEKP
ncbi:NepR family anti-sigma factor [Beijerinckia indica]|uniref:NepR family anti-sigma factor n=1 Tax=Beijerinckia indica TaxID=533 RepID=UPI0002E1A0A6|nr:NepR family anti-sigma factor [Beijerinckia indica]